MKIRVSNLPVFYIRTTMKIRRTTMSNLPRVLYKDHYEKSKFYIRTTMKIIKPAS